jgi:hypothetical protein
MLVANDKSLSARGDSAGKQYLRAADRSHNANYTDLLSRPQRKRLAASQGEASQVGVNQTLRGCNQQMRAGQGLAVN